jgi:hypothetical protein
MLGRLAVFVIVVLLLLTSLTGNAVVASQRTVLDSGFVTNSMAEEDAYTTLHETVLSDGEFPFAEGETELPPFAADIASRVVTPAYLQNQTEGNVRRGYAYLHGDREELLLAVDLRPVKNRTPDAVADVVRNTTVRELVEQVGIGNVSPPGVPVNTSLVLSLTEGPESYDEARERFREALRAEAISQIVNTSYQSLNDDQRLGLVIDDYNPDEYTAEEKDQLVSEREDDIRAVLRQRITENQGDEIDRRLQEQLNSSRQTMKDSLADPDTGTSEEIDAAAGDLLGVFVDGLTAEDPDYATFDRRLTTAKDDLAPALGSYAESELDQQLPDRLVLTEDIGPDAREQLSSAREAIGIVDLLGVALPAAALLLIGLLALVSRSAGVTAMWTGVAAVAGGLPVFLGAQMAGDRLTAAVAEAAPESEAGQTLADLGLAVVERFLGTVEAQSLALVALGLVLTAAGIALRLGALGDRLQEQAEQQAQEMQEQADQAEVEAQLGDE